MSLSTISRILLVINLCFSVIIISLFSAYRTNELKGIVQTREIQEERDEFSLEDRISPPSSIEIYWNSTAHRFENRLRRMRNACATSPQPPAYEAIFVEGKPQATRILGIRKTWKPLMNFLVDVPRHLLVCAVPKCGSTTWHRTIWAIRKAMLNQSVDQRLYTPDDTVRNQGIAMHLDKEDGNKLISHIHGDDDFQQNPPGGSSFRIILARHPFARFISGWNQKFMLSTNYWLVLVKAYPDLLKYKKKIHPHRVMAFEDFASYAADHPATIRSKDQHFIPATILCKPCEYDYTYVLKAETADDDEPWLKDRIKLDDINVGRRGIPPGGSVVNDDVKGNIKKYMSSLSPNTVRGLYEIYKQDFEIFGYTFNFTTLEAGGFD